MYQSQNLKAKAIGPEVNAFKDTARAEICTYSVTSDGLTG